MSIVILEYGNAFYAKKDVDKKHLTKYNIVKYKNNPDIKWNFTKFVVDRKGNVVARFEPTAKMSEVDKCVEELL